MKNIRKFICPYYFEQNPLEKFRSNLESAKFKILHLELRELNFVYENEDALKSKYIIFLSIFIK